MSDDFVPEEKEPAYQRLLTALRSSAQGSAPITDEEQAQMIDRVRERLAHAAPAATSDVGTFAPQGQPTPLIPVRRVSKPARLAANLLAALVVIGLILGSWTLFRAYSPSTRTTNRTTVPEMGPTAQAQAGGLVVSMHVLVAGPYFLSELLPVDVSFANHTQRPASLAASVRITNNSVANVCFSSEYLVQVTKGSNPSYTLPQMNFACFQPLFMNEVSPGQTITIHEYVPLTKSGKVALATGTGNISGDPNSNWPAIHMQMQVNPQIPQDRVLSLQSQKGQITIEMPTSATAHLLSMQSVTCENYGGGSGQWQPLSTNVLHEPPCPTAHRHWVYIVGAPGYAIVSGSQSD